MTGKVSKGQVSKIGGAQVFKYEKPSIDRGKGIVWLGRGDLILSVIQVVNEGGENNLHSHSAEEGIWFVLGGRVRFYGEGDTLLAELGKYEGILIPRAFQYWFEKVGDEPAELFQVHANIPGVKDKRTDYTPQKEATRNYKLFKSIRPERTGRGVTVSEPQIDLDPSRSSHS